VERERAEEITRLLLQGKTLALVSDAGTPLNSDPGFPHVRAAIDAGVVVQPVPGPTALVAAVVASGVATDRFCFDGALPRRRGHRAEFFSNLMHEPRTTVVYESPHRLLESLELLMEALPERRVVLARELTKIHEEFLRGTAAEILAILRGRDEVRGECVLVIEGGSPPGEETRDAAAEAILSALQDEGLSKPVLQKILQAVGVSRNRAYDWVHRESD
jgi:16S rRNA (cytidine1402-2'-O)-methyltransferase